MIDFIIEHYDFILWVIYAVISILISLIVVIVSINRKDSSVKEFILENLPYLINAAEISSCDGVQKKVFVMKAMRNLIKEHFPKVITFVFNSFISKKIETILSTPQKK